MLRAKRSMIFERKRERELGFSPLKPIGPQTTVNPTGEVREAWGKGGSFRTVKSTFMIEGDDTVQLSIRIDRTVLRSSVA